MDPHDTAWSSMAVPSHSGTKRGVVHGQWREAVYNVGAVHL
jgi:hypothetical protein